MNITFYEIDRNGFDIIGKDCFDLFFTNMNKILNIKSDQKSREEWISCISDALAKDPRKFVIIKDDETLAGFFMYYVNNGKFMMEEIQLKSEYQGQGIFRRLYKYLIGNISGAEYAEAYVNKENEKSKSLLSYLGLAKVGDEGENYLYRGSYKTLIEKIYER